MRPIAKQKGLVESREQLMKLFNQLTRENLHIILAFSPVGEKLRNRCRQFPSIINCCTIDWFNRWPDEALYTVAQREYKMKEELGIANFVDKLAEMSVKIHRNVILESERFYNELRRKNYVTPTSYLELVKLYLEMMKAQQSKLPLQIRKYTIGLQTLKETNEVVSQLQIKIKEFQPILEQSSKEKAELMVVLERENAIEKEKLEICSKDTAEAEIKKNEVNTLKNICQADLDRALPIQRAAEKAVANVDKGGITQIKSFVSPSPKVVTVLCAVCLIFGEQENWETAKRKILSNMNLQNDLAKFDPKTIDEKTINKLRKNYISLAEFTVDNLTSVSTAAAGMCGWVRALNDLYDVEKEIAPKKKKLDEAEKQLEKVNGELNLKKKDLKAIEDNKAALQKKFDNIVR
jgi:dynein heavy chain